LNTSSFYNITPLHFLLFLHHPISESDNPFGVGGKVCCVGDHNDGLALMMKFLEEFHNFTSGDRVEIPSRFIREDNLWVIEECSGDSDALLLSSRELSGHTGKLITQAEAIHKGFCTIKTLSRVEPGVDSWKCYVFERIKAREEIELLEYETDFAIANIGERLIISEVRYIVSLEQECATGEGIEESDDIEKRGLARSTLAHECDEFSPTDDEIDIPEHGDFRPTREEIRLPEVLELDNRRSYVRLLFCEVRKDFFHHENRGLFKCVDRVESRGPEGWVDTKDERYGDSESEGEDISEIATNELEDRGEVIDGENEQFCEKYPDEGSEEGEYDTFREELEDDIALSGSDRPHDSDVSGAFCDRGVHDIHDPDPRDNEDEDGDPDEEESESLGD